MTTRPFLDDSKMAKFGEEKGSTFNWKGYILRIGRMTMAAKLFGTDGVRGRANKFPMTVELALALGRAVGVLFVRSSKIQKLC